MDKNRLLIFKTDLNAQLQLVTIIEEKLKQRSENLNSEDIIRLESVAYQIHNLYNAVEDLLKIVATYFENNITDNSQWHSALLRRMTQEVSGIRPALLSSESYSILNSLRGFRHFFRHAYGSMIEFEQLKLNLDKALVLLSYLEQDLTIFMEKIEI
ncbi:hypothetical protein ACN4EE_08220 [Geminocystis sp. CENA526]|uniref:ribonuclease toxin HepT-like protein n=1 Tax=Geminocystis sp. CENA526 TaxID=1355871 RepID=UPI003D6F4007